MDSSFNASFTSMKGSLTGIEKEMNRNMFISTYVGPCPICHQPIQQDYGSHLAEDIMKEDAAEKALNVLDVMVPILGNARAQVLLCEAVMNNAKITDEQKKRFREIIPKLSVILYNYK